MKWENRMRRNRMRLLFHKKLLLSVALHSLLLKYNVLHHLPIWKPGNRYCCNYWFPQSPKGECACLTCLCYFLKIIEKPISPPMPLAVVFQSSNYAVAEPYPRMKSSDMFGLINTANPPSNS